MPVACRSHANDWPWMAISVRHACTPELTYLLLGFACVRALSPTYELRLSNESLLNNELHKIDKILAKVLEK
ncbi:MAG: hypothetical protein AABY34_04190 [Pseudomonadota bacterium]